MRQRNKVLQLSAILCICIVGVLYGCGRLTQTTMSPTIAPQTIVVIADTVGSLPDPTLGSFSDPTIAPTPTATLPPPSIGFDLPHNIPAPEEIYQIEFSPDGQMIAVATLGKLVIYRVDNDVVARTIADEGHFVWSSDSQSVAIGSLSSDDPGINLWRVADSTLLHHFAVDNMYFEGVALSADGLLFASGPQNIYCWRIADGTLLWSIKGDEDAVRWLVLSPNGQFLAINTQTSNVNLYQATDGSLLHSFPQQSWGYGSLAFSADSQMLASTHYDGNAITLWGVQSGKQLQELAFPTMYPVGYWLLFSPRDTLFVAGSTDSTVVWNTQTGKPQQIFDHAGLVAFSPDGNMLAIASPNALALRKRFDRSQ